MPASPQQLGFGFDEIEEQQETAHLPSAMGEGIAHYRTLLEQHHQAMLAGDEKTALAIRKDANRLAVKLNDGDIAILGDAEAPGYVLMRETAAPSGTVPIWGQAGDFTITIGDMPLHIVMDGMIGACAGMSVWPGFSANIVERDKPFLSETGFRSFLSVHASMRPGLTPDVFAREAIETYIKDGLKGRLRPVKAEYRGRF